MEYTLPSLQTLVIIGLFVPIYLIYLVNKVIKEKLDLFDLLMLSMVAIVPGIFIFFPAVAIKISQLAGVKFPFLIMFGALFLVTFLFLHRQTVQIHKVRRRSELLIQEIGLLRQKLDGQAPDTSEQNPSGNLDSQVEEPARTQ